MWKETHLSPDEHKGHKHSKRGGMLRGRHNHHAFVAWMEEADTKEGQQQAQSLENPSLDNHAAVVQNEGVELEPPLLPPIVENRNEATRSVHNASQIISSENLVKPKKADKKSSTAETTLQNDGKNNSLVGNSPNHPPETEAKDEILNDPSGSSTAASGNSFVARTKEMLPLSPQVPSGDQQQQQLDLNTEKVEEASDDEQGGIGNEDDQRVHAGVAPAVEEEEVGGADREEEADAEASSAVGDVADAMLDEEMDIDSAGRRRRYRRRLHLSTIQHHLPGHTAT